MSGGISWPKRPHRLPIAGSRSEFRRQFVEGCGCGSRDRQALTTGGAALRTTPTSARVPLRR